MSLVLPIFYHWAPATARPGILKKGLKPTCPTAVRYQAGVLPGTVNGRIVESNRTHRMVCLGTSPSHAWNLSGNIQAAAGELWDIWQVALEEHDEVHPLPFFGNRLDEIRVANVIAKSQLWLVGQRTA